MNYRLPLLILWILASLSPGAQEARSSSANGIAAAVHQPHAGKIVFSAGALPAAGAEKGFLTTYRFTPKSDLYFTAFLERPLLQDLSVLAPGLPAEELLRLGSYQFTFYVDDRLVYRDSLHPQSLRPAEKEKETVIGRPLVAHPFQNLWGAYLWFRFLRNGGEQALTEGKHRLKIEMRPSVQSAEWKTGAVAAAGEVVLDVQNPKIDPATMSLHPVTPYNGLPVSKDAFDREKIKELKAREGENVFKDITSIVVLKDGKILLEEYFNKAGRNTLHDVRSVGKTFASTMTGIAIGEGHLKSEYQTLKEFYDLRQFAHFSPAKEAATIRDLLTMSSIFEGDDNKGDSPGREDNMYPTADWVKFTLDLPADTANADGRWHYFTAGVVLLGDILHRSVPGGLEAYADAKLFRPLGITDYKWQYTPQKVANTAGGIRMNALDFAKYAQLYKNGGQWQGRTVVPKEWVDKSFTKVKTLPRRQNEYYGYLFWNKTYTVNGQGYEAFYCAGNGGNHLYIFKDIPFVIVVTGAAYNRPYAHSQVHTIMESYVLPAVLNGK
ncbi:MAG TPA: serine hydrolase [Chitinophagaceae bacterium]|nr:serine hydrolase [Chitinophagaceae bacterium]